MFFIKKLLKYSTYLLLLIALYVLISILISFITVNKKQTSAQPKSIFLSTNGIHLSIVLPVEELSSELKKNLTIPQSTKYLRFGWGDENFYLNTPTWNDFKFKYAFGALFSNNPTVMEVTPIKSLRKDWVRVPINNQQLFKLNNYVANSFKLDKEQGKIIIPQNIYPNSQLFKANGSYSPVKTCNTWANTAFKESELKASYWTLFDFGLLNKYR